MDERILQFKSKFCSLVGACLLGLPVFFLESTVFSGIFCILGFSFLLLGGKIANQKSDWIASAVFIWLGFSIRFCTFFGTEILYTFLVVLCLVPYAGAIFGSIFLCKIIEKTKYRHLSVLVFPAAYTFISVFLSDINLGYLTNLAGYFMILPPIARSLSFLGEYGMTFWLMLIISCTVTLVTEKEARIKTACTILAITLTATPLAIGLILNTQEREPDYSLQISLASSQEMDFLGENGTFYRLEEQITMFETALQQAQKDGADLLVLNEEYFSVDFEEEDRLYGEISTVVRTYQIPVLAGIELFREDDLSVNEAIYWNSDGTIEYTYIKNNLVPFIEAGDYVDGEEQPATLTTTVGGHAINLSFIICYDVNDENYVKKVSDSTELLIVPSWDWDTVNVEQLRTSVRSSIKKLTLLKHTFEGFSFVSTPYGKRVETIDFRKQYEKTVTVSVPIWEK